MPRYARTPYIDPRMLAWLQAMENAGTAQAAEKARLMAQHAPLERQEVLRRDLGGPTGPPPATNPYQVALSEQPWQTEIYRGGKLSEVNTGRAYGQPLQVSPGAMSGYMMVAEPEMNARVQDLTAKARRFDPVAQQRWQQFTADQAKIEAWAKDFNATPEELFDVKSQLFKKFVVGFDWDSHVVPNGQMIGDIVEDGLWLKEKTKDGFKFAGWNYKLPEEQRAELARSLIQPIMFGGRIVGYAMAEEARGKINVEWLKDDPKAQWDNALAIQESEANLQKSFQARYGRPATPVEAKQLLGRQLGSLGVSVQSDYFNITDDDIRQSVIEWGQYVQQFLPPGQREMLADPLQAAIFSWQTRGRLRKWVQDEKGRGTEGELIVLPPAIDAAIGRMIGVSQPQAPQPQVQGGMPAAIDQQLPPLSGRPGQQRPIVSTLPAGPANMPAGPPTGALPPRPAAPQPAPTQSVPVQRPAPAPAPAAQPPAGLPQQSGLSPQLEQAKQVYLSILDKIESGQTVAKEEYEALGRAAQVLDSAGVSEEAVFAGRKQPVWNPPPAPKRPPAKPQQAISQKTLALAKKNLQTIETQEQFDALPRGTLFLDKQGRIWRKP